jgi:regulatory protein
VRERQETGKQAGTITHLAVQQRQPNRISVFLDGAFAFGVSQELVRTWDLRVGRTLSVAEQAHIAADEQRLAARATALQYLATRPRTAYEVRQKLHRSGVPDAVVDEVMAHCQALNLLNDAAYTQAYLTSRLTNRGYGPQRLGRELHQRGIGRTLVEAAVQEHLPAEDVLAAARAQAAKRWPRLAREADHARRRQKLYDFLRRRGFASAIVQQIVTELAHTGDSDRESE